MKETKLYLLFILCSSSLFGQVDSLKFPKNPDKTEYLFNAEKMKVKTLGIYFAPEIGGGLLNKQFVPYGSGSLMLLLNKKIGIGVNSSMIGTHKSNADISFRSEGVKLEYILKPNAKVHTTFPLIIGNGFARNDSVNRDFGNNYNRQRGNKRSSMHDGIGNGNRFFVIQPGVNIEANLAKYVRVFAGVNYRFVSKYSNKNSAIAVNSDSISANAVSGISATVGLKIGLFDYNLYRKDSLQRRSKKQYKRK
jgi:hypothetical protein